ncbi:hypothetical protein IFM89_028587 [Coptis chinensis]|uniref:Sm protein G n=1 Tax=Coptis chinensis TaxID=261450 RepID=A0A835M9Z1_9MAGN|nr:hypothetical protein IFM89_028587 [Coptis chinensis]
MLAEMELIVHPGCGDNSSLDSHDGGTTVAWVWASANRLLEAYKMLLKFLWTLRNIRDSHVAVSAGSSESTKDKPSSITKIIAECESVMTYLNRDLSILSTSVARERVKLDANRLVVGTLRGFDQFINLVLENTLKMNGNDKNDIGIVVSRNSVFPSV